MAPRIESAEDLERIVAEQTAAIKAMGELVQGMDQRIRLLTNLVDVHQDLITKLSGLPLRPAGGGLAN